MSLDSKLFSPKFPFSPVIVPFFYGIVMFIPYLAIRMVSAPGHGVGLSPFTEPILSNIGIERTHFSKILFFAVIFATIPLPIFGRLFDKIGIRRSATYSSLLFVFVLVFLGNIDAIILHASKFLPVDLAITVVLFIGLFSLKLFGQNLPSLSSRVMLPQWYNKKTCTVTGISGIFCSIIFGQTPKITNVMIEKFGYLNTWLMFAAIILLFLIPIIWGFCRDNPEQFGMYPDGIAPDSTTSNSKKKGIEDDPKDSKNLKQAMLTFDFWIFSAATTISTFTIPAIQIHLVDIFREASACIKNPFDIYFPITIISAAGGAILGIIQDRISIRYCLIAVFTIVSLIMFFLEYVSSDLGLSLFVFFYGLNWSVYGIMYSAIWPKLFGKNHLSHIISVATTFALFANAAAPSLMSIAKDHGSYFYMSRIIMILALCGLVSSIIYIVSAKTQRTKK